MLTAMRNLAGTTFAKIFLFGLLIVSFGAWGLADYVVTGDQPGTTAAYVGDREITIHELSGAYRQQLLQTGLSTLPPDQARGLGIALTGARWSVKLVSGWEKFGHGIQAALRPRQVRSR